MLEHLLIETMPINDAYVAADSGHRIERIDPGQPHEVCYCVSYGVNPYLITPTAQPRAAQVARSFAKSFDWGLYGLPPIRGDWRRVRGGGERSFFWRYPMGLLSVPNVAWLTKPSPHTGALKRQSRVRITDDQHAWRGRTGAIGSVYVDGSSPATILPAYPRYVVGRCYFPTDRITMPSAAIVRITGIRQQYLGDMTQADLHAEGYRDWGAFFARWRGRHRLDIPVWVIETEPVFTSLGEYPADLLRQAAPVAFSPPLQLPLVEVGA